MDKKTLSGSFVVLAVAMAVAMLLKDGYSANLMAWMAIAALIASGLRFVTLIGELNFAAAAFVGLGAYASGYSLTILEWPFAVSLICGGLFAALIGVAFGYVTLKTKGPYFLLIGFAFTEVIRLIYTRIDVLGGNSGMIGIFPPDFLWERFTVFAVGLSGILIIVMYAIEKSYLGKCFVGIRDNDQVVLSIGINVHMTKVLCLAIGAFVSGIAGGLTAFVNNVISPADFSFLLSTFALAYLKVGGEDHPLGPIAGAILLVYLSSVSLSFGGGDHIFYGIAIILTLLVMPKGIFGLIDQLKASRKRSSAVQSSARGSQA